MQVEEQHPLKQGLKPADFLDQLLGKIGVEEQHPLKQGLKKYYRIIEGESELVEEQHPLKQGLKRR